MNIFILIGAMAHQGPSQNWSSCNVKGLSQIKQPHFKSQFSQSEVLALQEVHAEYKQARSITLRLGFDDGFYSLAGKSSRGAAILWKNPWKRVQGTEIRDGEGRVAIVTLAKGDVKVVVASVYAPNLDKTVLVRQHYVSWLVSLRHLVDEAQRLGGCEALWVGGDFNQILDRTLDSWSKSPTVHVVPAGELQDLVWDWEAEDAFRFHQGDKKILHFQARRCKCKEHFQ